MDQELSRGQLDGPAPQCSQPLPHDALMSWLPVWCVAESINGSVVDELVSLDSCWVVDHLVFLIPFEQQGNGANLRCFSVWPLLEERCCCIFQNRFREKERLWLGWWQGSPLSRALAELIICEPSVCGQDFTFARLEPCFRRYGQKYQCESESCVRHQNNKKTPKPILALNGW